MYRSIEDSECLRLRADILYCTLYIYRALRVMYWLKELAVCQVSGAEVRTYAQGYEHASLQVLKEPKSGRLQRTRTPQHSKLISRLFCLPAGVK